MKTICFLICLFFVSPIISQIVEDTDGNKYRTVKIGTKTWMAQNLKTTRFNDGEPIEYGKNNDDWSGKNSSPKYCWYMDEQNTYGYLYGALYNAYAVYTKKLCPVGWHVPTESEWRALLLLPDAGNALKAKGDIWKIRNEGNNSTGFRALPGGYRGNKGFGEAGKTGEWWSSGGNEMYAWHFILRSHISRGDFGGEELQIGLSVRCVKD